MDWADFQTRRKGAPATRRVPLCADGAAASRLADARTKLAVELKKRDGNVDEARKVVEAAEAEVAEATIHVVVRALPAPDYQALAEDHRPSGEDAKEGMAWDPKTFPPALVEACLVDGPGDFDGFWSSLTIVEQRQLEAAAVGVNTNLPDLSFTEPGTG